MTRQDEYISGARVSVEFVHVGFGTVVALSRILVVTSPDSAPIKRLVQKARENDRLIDVTSGRKTKSVIILDTGSIVLAAIQPETITARATQQREVENAGARE